MIRTRLRGPGPHLIGLGGPVAVGKSTLADALSAALGSAGTRAAVVSTDAFLLPNASLEERGLLLRKGFPETYDDSAVEAFVAAIRREGRAEIPVYSHASYDIVPGRTQSVQDADVVIVEGVIATQSPLAGLADLTIYLDAGEPVVREWFVARFVELTAGARSDPSSFYAAFAGMDDGQIRSLAEATWDGINGVNLAEHIQPTRVGADVVVEKDADHRIVSVVARSVEP